MIKKLIIFCLITAIVAGCGQNDLSGFYKFEIGDDYPVYGGNKMNNRYSPLDQINIKNVNDLKVVWMYDASATEGSDNEVKQKIARQIQCQPIVVRGVMYGTTADLNLFAVDAETGKEIWKFVPPKDSHRYRIINVNRGVVYWERGEDRRILYTVGSNLYAVNANDGKGIISFGNKGVVDIREGLTSRTGKSVESLSVVATSPGVLYKNNLILGSGVAESGEAAPGHIRAFDVVTGKLNWVFHTVPQPGEIGYDTWPEDAYKKIGAANNWAGLSVDEKRGAVYFGTGSPASDFYGGDREGRNLFGNCIVALNAENGKLIWYFQTIRHDLWDRDIPCPPNLTTINYAGKKIDVVVQSTKDGLVYVLDRDKGTSLFPINEKAVPTVGLPGEHPWPTQLFPVKPLPLSRQIFTRDDITNISPEAHHYVDSQYQIYHSDNKFTPPSVHGTLLFGYSGGPEWGGNAVDPSGIFYQAANEDPWILQMIDTASRNMGLSTMSRGNGLYVVNCSACHGRDRRGNGTLFPSLIDIGKKLKYDEIQRIVREGNGRMPSFQQLSTTDRNSIIDFILGRKESSESGGAAHSVSKDSSQQQIFGFKPAYVNKVWRRLVDKDGYPGVKPPWGTLNAINLNTGEYLWRVPIGEYPELVSKGIPPTGTDVYGGPLVTAGGLIFQAGTRDEKIRALDTKTGKVVWEYKLPAGGFATPVTYTVHGKQYIVIAAGGARGQKLGGNYVAFALK